MTFIMFQRGATSWGFQIGKLYMFWPYFKYLKCGRLPTIGWEQSYD